MSATRTLALSAALGFLGFGAQAAPLDYVAMMHGTCSRLTYAGQDSSAACSPNVINSVHKDGRVGFTFVAGDKSVVTFSGMGQGQVKTSPNAVSQPLDTVIFTELGRAPTATATAIKADGACAYTNPYAGPAEVKCTAKTDKGVFEAHFLSDGQAPALTRF